MSAIPSPDTPAGIFSTDKIGGFGYGIAISIGILLLITTITLASYYCTRMNMTPLPPGSERRRHHHHRRHPRWHINHEEQPSDDVESGIDEATLMSYPKLLASDTKLGKAGACCSICLAEYKGSDELRQLPECGHVFHVACIDPWLRLHPTCPLCRTSPLPSPLPTPLAEVVPLAARQV